MAKKAGICEATSDEVSNNADDDAYDQVCQYHTNICQLAPNCKAQSPMTSWTAASCHCLLNNYYSLLCSLKAFQVW